MDSYYIREKQNNLKELILYRNNILSIINKINQTNDTSKQIQRLPSVQDFNFTDAMLYAGWINYVIHVEPKYSQFKKLYKNVLENKSLLHEFPIVSLKTYMRSKNTKLVTINFTNGFIATIKYNYLVRYTNYSDQAGIDMTQVVSINVTRNVWTLFCLTLACGQTGLFMCDSVKLLNITIEEEIALWKLFVTFECDSDCLSKKLLEYPDDGGLLLSNTCKFYTKEHYICWTNDKNVDDVDDDDDDYFNKLLDIHDSHFTPDTSDITKENLLSLYYKLGKYLTHDLDDSFNIAFIELKNTINNVGYYSSYCDSKKTMPITGLDQLLSDMIKSTLIDDEGKQLIFDNLNSLLTLFTQKIEKIEI